MTLFFVVRNAQGYAVAFGPADGTYSPTIPDGYTSAIEEDPDLTPPPPTAEHQEAIKRALLAEAMIKRDFLMGHLERLRTRAIEANNTIARDALTAAVTSLENAFNDQRVVDAIDGEVEPVLKTIIREIGLALGAASPQSLQALLALDAL